MPKNILFQATPLDPTTGLPVTVRMSAACSTGDSIVVNSLNWLPCITEPPTQSIEIYSGEVQETTISHGNVSFRLLTELNNLSWSDLSWDGADALIYMGDFGAAWASYTQIFGGKCGAIEREGQIATVALTGREAELVTDLLTLTYAGTGSGEGPATLKGTLKPRCYGECKNVQAVLIDPAYWIYQYHGYGATEDVTMVYENAYQVNATSQGTYATYAALKAATLVEGEWAKAPAVGMFRLGGEPSGKVTADVKGTKVSGTYVNSISGIVPDILQVDGLSSSFIDTTSFTNFDPTVTNLVTYSEQFDNAAWTKQNGCTVTANSVTAPDGTTTADKLIGATGANAYAVYEQFTTTAVAYTASIYVKPAGATRIYISLFDSGTVERHAWYDLTAVSVGTKETGVTADITALDDGWFRCTYTLATAFSGAGNTLRFGLAGADASTSYTGNSSNGVYLWGAQFETGSSANPYVVTTSASASAKKYEWCLYQTAQITVGEAARDALRQCGGYLFPSRTGVFKVGNYYKTATATALNGDRSVTPLVRDFKQLASAAPNWKVRVGYDRCWTVHSDSEISEALLNAGIEAEAAQADADAALAAATAAAADAADAAAEIAAIVDDDILDMSEKPDWVQRFSAATAEKTGIDAQATSLGITTEKTTYDTAYTALSTYLSGLSPAYTDYSQNTAITRTTAITKWNDWYAARTALLQKTADVAATKAAWANVTGAPTTLAGLDAASAATLADIADDNKLTPAEKVALRDTYIDLDSRYNMIFARATVVGSSTTAATTARTNWTTLLDSYSPAWNDNTQTTTIYTHWFADQNFPTGWTATTTNNASAGYTIVNDLSASVSQNSSRSKTQTAAATQYTVGLVVKKDTTAKTTRFAMLRVSGTGGTAKTCDLSFDTSTGVVASTGTGSWDASGSFDLGADWLIYATFTTTSTNTGVTYDIYPAAGANATMSSANYSVTTQGSITIKPPYIALGTLNALGLPALQARTKAYTLEIETLCTAVSAVDATLAAWSGVSGTGKPADFATRNGVGANELKDDQFASWTLTSGAAVITPTATNGYAAGNEPYALQLSPSTSITVSGTSETVPVTAGRRYYFGCRVSRGTTLGTGMNLQLAGVWMDSAGTPSISGLLGLTSTSVTAGVAPKEYLWTEVAPSGAVAFKAYYYIAANASNSGTVRIERPIVAQVGSVGAVSGSTAKTISYDYTGTALSGQLPATLTYQLSLNGVGQSSGVTWTYLVGNGGVNSFDNSSGIKSMTGTGVGTFTVTTLDTNSATVTITGVCNGVSATLLVTLTKDIGAPPAGGGSATGSVSGTTSSGTFADKSGAISFTMPAGKTTANIVATLTNTIDSNQASATETVEWKLERNVSGTWTQVGTTVSSTARERIVDVELQEWGITDGNVTMNISDTGRTAGTAYQWRISARRSSGSRVNYLSGNVTITAP